MLLAEALVGDFSGDRSPHAPVIVPIRPVHQRPSSVSLQAYDDFSVLALASSAI